MLRLEKINKSFGTTSENKKVIFKDFDLEVKKGDFLTILGGNGCGKSTLMNIISGSIIPESGRVFINGENVTQTSEYKRAKLIGRVFQDPLKGTAPHLTIEENLSLAFLKTKRKNLRFSINRNEREMLKEKLRELDFGLENHLNSKMGLLSGGQRQAITLLMATLQKPKILLLDEHTAALDPKSSEKVMKITKKIASDPEITTLMITHNINSALNTGSRTIMIENGKIIMDLDISKRKKVDINKIQNLFGNL